MGAAAISHAVCPRFPFPKTPDQTWQNDLDLDNCLDHLEVTLSSSIALGTTSYIRNSSTLQPGSTAYPTFLVVGTSATIPSLTISDRVGIGGDPLDPVGGTSPTNYKARILNGDMKISGTDRGTLLVERTSGAPQAGGGSHVKIIEARDWAPGDGSARFQIFNSSDGYVGYTTGTSTDQVVASPLSAAQLSMIWAGRGPTSGWVTGGPYGNYGYDGRNMGGIIMGGNGGNPLMFYNAGSTVAVIIDRGDYPLQVITNAIKRWEVSGNGMYFYVENSTRAAILGDGGLRIGSKSLASFAASTPTASGIQYFCSDCTTDALCVSTSTTLGNWARVSSKSTKCQ
jgi:hypothetical protein